MQQRLYLARHAHALDDAPSDDARPLSPKGHKQMKRLAQGLRGSSRLAPDLIWHSGLLRAEETAAALKSGLALDAPLLRKPGLAPNDDPHESHAALDALDQSCLVIGHDPHLSSLASLLLTGASGFERVVFAKASILCLSRMKAGQQSTPWQIEWHVSHHFFR